MKVLDNSHVIWTLDTAADVSIFKTNGLKQKTNAWNYWNFLEVFLLQLKKIGKFISISEQKHRLLIKNSTKHLCSYVQSG